jgi:pentatricopeptide repeat protein
LAPFREIAKDSDLEASPIEPTEENNDDNANANGNHDRNLFYRHAFLADGPVIRQKVKENMSSPFVPDLRSYPSAKATEWNIHHAQYRSRIQVGFDIILSYDGVKDMPDFEKTYMALKSLAISKESTKMAAMRVILPNSCDLQLKAKSVKYMEPITGSESILRVSPDHLDSHSVILRGDSGTLARAVDELSATYPELKAFKLGSVDAFDYEQQQLWPIIEGTAEGDVSLSKDNVDSLWAHREQTPHWIDTRYEDIPKPDVWTKENFRRYIAKLVLGRLRPHLATPLYAKTKEGRTFVDTDGVKVKLIMDAFEDPAAKPCITARALKMAMGCIMHKGGHRAAGARLSKLAEEYGLPMDTNFYNIMLDGCVTRGDPYHFHKILKQMKSRFFCANAGTWLLFLELVQKAQYRRQIIAVMYELGLLNDLAARRGIARIMASHDAFTAFKARKSLKKFMENQTRLYGEDWLTNNARHAIIQELLRCRHSDHDRIEEVKQLLAMESSDGQQVGIETINYITMWCVADKNWDFALWALKQMRLNRLEMDESTYDNIIRLALKCRSPSALGIAFFHSIVERKLGTTTRKLIRDVLLGRYKHGFWLETGFCLAPKALLDQFTTNRIQNGKDVVGRLQDAILKEYGQLSFAKPLDEVLETALRTMDSPFHMQRMQLRKGEITSDQVKVRHMVLKLTGPSGKVNACLNGGFNPTQMIRNWRGPSIASRDESPENATLGDASKDDNDRSLETNPREEAATPPLRHGNDLNITEDKPALRTNNLLTPDEDERQAEKVAQS